MIYENPIKEKFSAFPMAATVMQGGRSFISHCHQELELLVVCQGELRVTFEDEPCVLKAGDIWLVPPFGSHSIDGGSPDSVRLAVLADLKLAGWVHEENEQAQLQALLEGHDLYSGHWDHQVRDALREDVEAIYREYIRREEGWQLAIKRHLNDILLLVCRRTPLREKKAPTREVAKVRSILEYVALHYCSDISLEQCGAAVGFNPTYLSRYFHEHMGITFQEYVKRLRIDRARWILENEKMPITQIAYACGFRDIKTFNKLFKKECGMSPTQYRKNVKICVV